MILVKFWMHLSDEEQLRRFERRSSDVLKPVEADRRGLAQPGPQPRLRRGGEEMFERTDHELAPWDIIEAEQKRFGRIRVLEALNARIEQGMARWGHPVPPPEELAVSPTRERPGHRLASPPP